MKLTIEDKRQAAVIGEGIVHAIKWLWMAFAVVWAFASALYWLQAHYFPKPLNNSDTSIEHRSGLKVRTDALTGCQYLETSNGAVTPRIDRTGAPVCREAGQ